MKEQNMNWVEVEAAMEGIFIETHGDAKRQGNANPNRNAMLLPVIRRHPRLRITSRSNRLVEIIGTFSFYIAWPFLVSSKRFYV